MPISPNAGSFGAAFRGLRKEVSRVDPNSSQTQFTPGSLGDGSYYELGGDTLTQARFDDALSRGGSDFSGLMLKSEIEQGRGLESRANSLRARMEAQVANTGNKERRLASAANLAVQRDGSALLRGPRGFSRQLAQSVKRGRARQGIEDRGEKAIRNQQLKERIALGKSALAKRGQLMSAAANASTIRTGGQAAIQRANDQSSAATAGMVGAIAGGALRGFGDKLFDTGNLGEGMADQQGEVDSFFGAQGDDVGGLDNIFNGGGFDFGSSGGTVFG